MNVQMLHHIHYLPRNSHLNNYSKQEEIEYIFVSDLNIKNTQNMKPMPDACLNRIGFFLSTGWIVNNNNEKVEWN